MQELTDLQKAIGGILKELRRKKGLSKAKMADVAYIDAHTYSKWESGESSPTIAEFLYLFNALSEDALKPVLDYVYPSIYNGLTPQSSADELRQAAAHYFTAVASERSVRQWDFIVFGKHGSNIEPQLQEITALNHLPLDYRLAVANMILTFWRMAEARGELIAQEHIQPDIALLEDGIAKASKAAALGLNAYTTSIK